MRRDDTTPAPGERIYRALIRLYPAGFRELFGEMMLDFYRSRMRESADASTGLRVRLYADVVISAMAERMAPLRNRNAAQLVQVARAPMLMRLRTVRQDANYAIRNLRRQPAFVATVLLVLALGIGANVAIFSVVNGILLRPLPFADADRVVQLANGDAASTLSEPEVSDLERDARTFARVGAYSFADGTLNGAGEAERVRIARASGGFFPVLEPAIHRGRALDATDDRAGAADVAVISYGLWARYFGMRPDVIGQSIILNDVSRIVVGVTPPHFDYPNAAVDVWVPLRLDNNAMTTRNNHYLRVIARLAPSASIESSDSEIRAIRDQWARAYPDVYRPADPLQVDVRPIRERVLGETQPYLLALFGAVGFVLLIACVNVANLLLVRGEQRRRELMIRRALGATHARIVSQLSVESAILTLMGGALGLAVAWPLLKGIVAAAPASIPRVAEIQLDARAMLFAAGLAAVTAIVFALIPVARIARNGSFTGLNGASRNSSGAGDSRARRTRSALAVAEVALSVIMLAGAGVFIEALRTMQQTTAGFATDHVMTARVTMPRSAYRGEKPAAFTAALVERLRDTPGVTHAAAMAWTPMVSGGGNWSLNVESRPLETIAEAPVASPQQVTPGFFTAMSIPQLAGRDFTDADRATSEPVVIVNEALARLLWDGERAIGRRIRLAANSMPWMTVVGVVGDTRADGLTEAAPPIMYFPHQQAHVTGYFASLGMTVLVRTRGDEAAVIPAIKGAVRELDTAVPVSEIRSMGDVVGSSIASHRFTTLLLSTLAGIAVLIAGIGIHGVIAHGVAQRRYEFGVRMALGAGRGRVISLVMGEGLLVALVGLLFGAAGAAALGRLLSSMLENVAAPGPRTFGVAAVVLVATAVLAALAPARRATGIDPIETIRNA